MPTYQPPIPHATAVMAHAARVGGLLLLVRFLLSFPTLGWVLCVAVLGLYMLAGYYDCDIDRPADNQPPIATEEEIREGNVGPRRVDLPFGFTEFDIKGPKDGPTVVCVHGFQLNCNWIMPDLINGIASKGYRVVSIVLYGRGGSDTPRNVEYNDCLFVSQLVSLVTKLNLASSFHLLGYSMGGAISIRFSELYPEKIKSLTLLAPAGMPMPMPLASKILTVPLLGRVAFNFIFPARARTAPARDFQDPTTPIAQSLMELNARASKFNLSKTPGFLRAVESTVLHFPFSSLEPSYEAWGKRNKPTLVLWGDRDPTVPYSGAVRVAKAIPHARIETFSGKGHMFYLEEHERALGLILSHLEAVK